MAGDDLPVALDRLHSIVADPQAGRAPRDAMVAAFEGLDRWIPLGVRESLSAGQAAGALRVESITLDDKQTTNPIAVKHLRYRWKAGSPLFRAGHAILAHMQQRDISPDQVHLHGQDVVPGQTPYFAGIGWRYWGGIQRCLTDHGGVEWIEVIRPTLAQPLNALVITPLDRDVLKTIDW